MKTNKITIILLIILAIFLTLAIYLYQLPVIYGTMFNIRNILLYVIALYVLGVATYVAYKKLNIKEEHQLPIKMIFSIFILVMMIAIGKLQMYYLETYVIPTHIATNYYDKYDNLIYQSVLPASDVDVSDMTYEIIDLEEALTFGVVEQTEEDERLSSVITVKYNVYSDLISYELESRYQTFKNDRYIYEGLKRKVTYTYDTSQVLMTHTYTIYQEESVNKDEIYQFDDYKETKIVYQMDLESYNINNTADLYEVEETIYNLSKYSFIDDEISSFHHIGDASKETLSFQSGKIVESINVDISDQALTFHENVLFGKGATNNFFSYSEDSVSTQSIDVSYITTESYPNHFSQSWNGGYKIDNNNQFDENKLEVLNGEIYYKDQDITTIHKNHDTYQTLNYYLKPNNLRGLDNIINDEFFGFASDEMFVSNDLASIHYALGYVDDDLSAINFKNPLFLIQNDYARLYQDVKRSAYDIKQDNRLLEGYQPYFRDADEDRVIDFMNSFDFESQIFYAYDRNSNGYEDYTFLNNILYQDKQVYRLFQAFGSLADDLEIDDSLLVREHGTVSRLTFSISHHDEILRYPLNIMYIEENISGGIVEPIEIDDYQYDMFEVADNGYFRLLYNANQDHIYSDTIISNINGVVDFDVTENVQFNAKKEFLGITMTLTAYGEEVVKVHRMDGANLEWFSNSFYYLYGDSIDQFEDQDMKYVIESVDMYDRNLFIHTTKKIDDQELSETIKLSVNNNYTYQVIDDDLSFTYTFSYDPELPNYLKLVIVDDLGAIRMNYYQLVFIE